MVDRAGHVGQQLGVAVRVAGDERAELHPLGDRGHLGVRLVQPREGRLHLGGDHGPLLLRRSPLRAQPLDSLGRLQFLPCELPAHQGQKLECRCREAKFVGALTDGQFDLTQRLAACVGHGDDALGATMRKRGIDGGTFLRERVHQDLQLSCTSQPIVQVGTARGVQSSMSHSTRVTKTSPDNTWTPNIRPVNPPATSVDR